MVATRRYTMTARAEAAERTRLSIIRAAAALGTTTRLADVSLEDVAREAGVSVQTVLRRFGSRAGLFRAATEHVSREVVEERAAPVGDVDAALLVIVDHYERRGDGVLLLLAQEDADELVRSITGPGRGLHRDWVATVFAPYLPDAGPARDALVDLLVVATDVYVWKLLRRDRGLDRATTTGRMRRLVAALIDEGPT